MGAGYDIKNQSPAILTMGFNEDEKAIKIIKKIV
jgi:hypothetical protein